MPHCERVRLVIMVLVLSFALSISGPDSFGGNLALRSVQAQDAPQVEISPASAAPGTSVTLFGSGWPPGVVLRARLYRESDVLGPGADLRLTFEADEVGAFTAAGVIPPTLFGAGGRGNVEVTPGPYTIVVRAGPDLYACMPFDVIPADADDGEMNPP